MAFSHKYMFGKTNIVVIQHPGGKHIRVTPGDLDNVDGDGGQGEFALWEAEPQDGGSKVRFKSLKSHKYLRIIDGDKGIYNFIYFV